MYWETAYCCCKLLDYLLPYLSSGKVGKERELEFLEIVQAIFYRLKTGLPMEGSARIIVLVKIFKD